MMSLVSAYPQHPPHMVLMIYFPEKGFPVADDMVYSQRCTELWATGLPELKRETQTTEMWIGDRPFKVPPRKLHWTHVAKTSKAHTRGNASVGHYLLHPPQQMVGGYHGLLKAGYIEKKASSSAEDIQGFKFVRQAKVRWASAIQDGLEEDLFPDVEAQMHTDVDATEIARETETTYVDLHFPDDDTSHGPDIDPAEIWEERFREEPFLAGP